MMSKPAYPFDPQRYIGSVLECHTAKVNLPMLLFLKESIFW